MSQGVSSVLYAATVNLWQSGVKPILDNAPNMAMKKTLPALDTFKPIFGILETPELVDAERTALNGYHNIIHGLYVRTQDREIRIITRWRILTFPIIIDPKVIELLRMQEPRAMIVLTHFFAIVKLADEIW